MSWELDGVQDNPIQFPTSYLKLLQIKLYKRKTFMKDQKSGNIERTSTLLKK